MLRVALLTTDVELWCGLSAVVRELQGEVFDLRLMAPDERAERLGGRCDAVVVDARAGGGGGAPCHALQTRWTVPAMALVEHEQASLLPAFLRQSESHDLAFLASGPAALLGSVRRFLSRRSGVFANGMHGDSYVLNFHDHEVRIDDQRTVRMSTHKFQFAAALLQHRDMSLRWSQLYRRAWGVKGSLRSAAVAAHAGWALETLELNGSHGLELLCQGSDYLLRSTSKEALQEPENPGDKPDAIPFRIS